MVDINPNVVVTGLVMTEQLKQAKNEEDFIENYFTLTKDQFIDQANRVLKSSGSSVLREDWLLTNPNAQTPIDSWRFYRGVNGDRVYQGKAINVVDVVLRNFSALQALAMSESLPTIYGDITDGNLIGAIKALPDFDTSINVIYGSNIEMFAATSGDKDATKLPLKAFESYTHPSIFIGAEGQPLQLKATRSIYV